MTARRVLLTAAAAASLLVAAGACGGGGLPDKVRYAAPPQAVLLGGVSVQFQKAWSEDDEFRVNMYFVNMSNQVMFVNRDGIGLRLPDGRVMPREGMNQTPYRLNPGEGHDVYVKFEPKGMKLDMRTIQQASVIVGGIYYGNDPMPRTVGEIPLSWAGAMDD